MRKHVNDKDISNAFENQDCNVDDTQNDIQNNREFNVSAINHSTASLISNSAYNNIPSYDNETINETRPSKMIKIEDSSIPEFQMEESLKKMINFVTEFVLTLHNNKNFSRKDVFEIQEYANKCLIDPLLDIMKLFVNNKLQANNSVHNEFCSLISNCRNPFKFLNTEYLLHNWLRNENYIENIQEFTIDNTIRPIHQNGNFTYDEKQTKGALMPLRFQFKKHLKKIDF